MLDLVQNFEFLRPWMFLFIAPIVLFVPLLRFKSQTQSAWQKVCEAKFLNYLLIKGDNKSQKGGKFLIYAALLSALLALSGPSFEKTEQPALSGQNPVMILLDLSEDMQRTDIRPSRLDRAKIEIIDVLKQSKAAPSGLIVYSGEPFVISPLSEDDNIIINLLKAVLPDIMPLKGNRPDRAVELAVQRLKQAGFAKGNIVLFSSSVSKEQTALADLSAKEALNQGLKVSVYDFSAAASKELKQIAKSGGGVYLNALEGSDTALIDLLSSYQQNDLKESQNHTQVPQDNGWIFVIVTAFLTLLLFKRGILVVVFALMMSSNAKAGFWLSPDYEAMHAFSKGQYQAAADTFKNQKWKASAAYKAGDYQNASQLFGRFSDIESVYNRGNALAKSGDIDGAIKAYESVLKEDPTHEDAKFNLEYLKKLKQNEQSQNNKQNENEQQNQNNQNSADNNREPNSQDNQNSSSSQNDEQNEDENRQENSAQSNASAGDESKDQANEEADAESQNDASNGQNEQSMERQQSPVIQGKEGDADEYNEAVWAREQQFRDIKEDTGGLLKAFIYQEYLKKRYED